MRLLSLDKFATIFEPLATKQKRVGVVDGIGNVGDYLLYSATRQLLDAFGVEHQTVNPLAEKIPQGKFDKLLLFAGGNMGYPPCTAIRKAAVDTGIPCWVLPQSVILFEEQAFERVFIRDHVSCGLSPRFEYVPDIALGFDFPAPPTTGTRIKGNQLFVRRHGHALFSGMGADPAEICHTPKEYWELASKYESITTDRLHFAITAMAMGVDVTLLPVAYHKNKAMYDEWLKPLGCKWADQPE